MDSGVVLEAAKLRGNLFRAFGEGDPPQPLGTVRHFFRDAVRDARAFRRRHGREAFVVQYGPVMAQICPRGGDGADTNVDSDRS